MLIDCPYYRVFAPLHSLKKAINILSNSQVRTTFSSLYLF